MYHQVTLLGGERPLPTQPACSGKALCSDTVCCVIMISPVTARPRRVRQPLCEGRLACVQVIVFSFSKKECESLALQMVGMDLTSEDEKKLIEGVFNSAKDLLAEADAR